MEVTAEARHVGQDGKLFVFELTARDRGGEIGRGTHERAIVAADRLLGGAQPDHPSTGFRFASPG
jgi:fluoroacetyl-CoA thioesterase